MEAWLALAPYFPATEPTPDVVLLPEPPAVVRPQMTVEQIDETLTVIWTKKEIKVKDQLVVFSGGVTAKYGPTTLRAQTLKLWLKEDERRGLAEGTVQIDDPDGKGSAEKLEFNWKDRTGNGSQVRLVAAGIGEIRAETLEIRPEEWVFLNAYASPQEGGKPIASVRSPRVVYRPGKNGTAKPAIIQLFGREVLRLPSYRFGEKRQEGVIRLPNISYNKGFGLAWNGSYFVDDRSLLSSGLRARTGESTGIQVLATRSFLPRNEPGVNAPPQSDLGERFGDGWFDSIFNWRPSDERSNASQRRSSFSLGFELNQAAVARRNDELYSRPLFAVLEHGLPLGDFGFYSALRAENVREADGPVQQRASLALSTLLPSFEVTEGLTTHARLDTQGWMSARPYAWTRAQLGLIYEPDPRFRVGVARVFAEDFGRPMFDADRLYSQGGWQLRVDADLGASRLSYLAKYDFERRKWYDNEISFSQKAGVFEPYVGFREFPRSLNFGVRLRTDDLFARLKRRTERRPNKPTN